MNSFPLFLLLSQLGMARAFRGPIEGMGSVSTTIPMVEADCTTSSSITLSSTPTEPCTIISTSFLTEEASFLTSIDSLITGPLSDTVALVTYSAPEFAGSYVETTSSAISSITSPSMTSIIQPKLPFSISLPSTTPPSVVSTSTEPDLIGTTLLSSCPASCTCTGQTITWTGGAGPTTCAVGKTCVAVVPEGADSAPTGTATSAANSTAYMAHSFSAIFGIIVLLTMW